MPIPLLVVAAVLLLMLVELQLSAYNERQLRARGAIEPADDVYRVMRLAYPAAFVAMGAESAVRGTWSRDWLLLGLLLFGWAKALKFWAIAHLGTRWTFRVLVPPGAPLVATGPYRLLKHPNYVAVVAELVSIALALQAPVSGFVGTAGFAWLIRRRIAVEERALGEHGASGHTTGPTPPG